VKRTARQLTCRELADFLAEYLDGTLDPDTRILFDAHLAVCPDCVTYLRSYAQTIRLAKAACGGPDDPVPAGVPDELVRAIVAARRRRRRALGPSTANRSPRRLRQPGGTRNNIGFTRGPLAPRWSANALKAARRPRSR